jgi:GTP-binding protein HflX
VRLADLLLHVADVSHPEFQQHIAKVNEVLSELGALEKPTLVIYNKIDKLDGRYPFSLSPDADGKDDGVFVSAQQGIGISSLAERIAQFTRGDWVEARLFLEKGNSDLLPFVYKMGVVMESRFENGGISLRIRGKKENLQKIRKLDGGFRLEFLAPQPS